MVCSIAWITWKVSDEFHLCLLNKNDNLEDLSLDVITYKINPDALPNAGVREAIEPTTMGNGEEVQM
jgi:hypothetical protein